MLFPLVIPSEICYKCVKHPRGFEDLVQNKECKLSQYFLHQLQVNAIIFWIYWVKDISKINFIRILYFIYIILA